ncbi:unnamed protein product [Brassica oleracea var. botrytis]
MFQFQFDTEADLLEYPNAPRDSRDSRDSRDFRVQDAQLPPPPARQPRSRPSDRSPGRPEIAREEASSTKKTTATPLRRPPSPEPPQNLPAEVLNEARAELREVMTQYTSCADPSESAARKERLRQAEQNGQLEESVALMARASLANLPKRNLDVTQHASPERIPALL